MTKITVLPHFLNRLLFDTSIILANFVSMEPIFNPVFFYSVVWIMAGLAVIVFLALHKVEAAYGMTYSKTWGPALSNRTGWIIMEAPAFICMLLLWILSPRAGQLPLCIMAGMFEIHYFQRTFIFPFLIRGKSRMPWAIVIMGMIFNTVNTYMIGGWLFYVSYPDTYTSTWLISPQFIIGTLIFIFGMVVNLHSDSVIRHLRKPGDTRHYIPCKGMYRWVTAGNYFGEFTEWVGFAILTWSLPGAVFALWTFANLAPRARSLYQRYTKEFGTEFTSLRRKYILPFLY